MTTGEINIIGGMDTAAFVALQAYQQARLELDRAQYELQRAEYENINLPAAELKRRTDELKARLERAQLVFDQRKEEATQATDRWKVKKGIELQIAGLSGGIDTRIAREEMGKPFTADENLPDLAATSTAPPGVRPPPAPGGPPGPGGVPSPSVPGPTPTPAAGPPAPAAGPSGPASAPAPGPSLLPPIASTPGGGTRTGFQPGHDWNQDDTFQPPAGIDPSLLPPSVPTPTNPFPPGLDPDLTVDRPTPPPTPPPAGLDPSLLEPSAPAPVRNVNVPPGAQLDENGNLVAMQYGGVVTKPTAALIGESGPEAVVPLRRQPQQQGWGSQQTQDAQRGASPAGAWGQQQGNPETGWAPQGGSRQASQGWGQQQGRPQTANPWQGERQALSGETLGMGGQTQNPYAQAQSPRAYAASGDGRTRSGQEMIDRARQAGDTAWLAGRERWEADRGLGGYGQQQGRPADQGWGQQSPYGTQAYSGQRRASVMPESQGNTGWMARNQAFLAGGNVQANPGGFPNPYGGGGERAGIPAEPGYGGAQRRASGFNVGMGDYDPDQYQAPQGQPSSPRVQTPPPARYGGYGQDFTAGGPAGPDPYQASMPTIYDPLREEWQVRTLPQQQYDLSAWGARENLGLQQGSLTGRYGGQETLAGRGMTLNERQAGAGITGYDEYGRPTMGREAQEFGQGVQAGALTGYFGGNATAAERQAAWGRGMGEQQFGLSRQQAEAAALGRWGGESTLAGRQQSEAERMAAWQREQQRGTALGNVGGQETLEAQLGRGQLGLSREQAAWQQERERAGLTGRFGQEETLAGRQQSEAERRGEQAWQAQQAGLTGYFGNNATAAERQAGWARGMGERTQGEAERRALQEEALRRGEAIGNIGGQETLGGRRLGLESEIGRRSQTLAEQQAERQWQFQQAQMAANPANYAVLAALRGQQSGSGSGSGAGGVSGLGGTTPNPYGIGAPPANRVGPQAYDRMRPDERAAFGSTVVAGGQSVGDYEQQLNRQRPNQRGGSGGARWR